MTVATITTLDDLTARVRQDQDLSATRRRDLVSDLNCIARLLGRNPVAVPADLKALKRVINDLHPIQAGISTKRLQNVKSSLTFVFARYQIVKSINGQLSPEWQAFMAALVSKRERDGLSSLSRYCSGEAISPAAVDDAAANAWLQWMLEDTLRKKPRAVHRQACKIWNEVCNRLVTVPCGTALNRLAVPDNRKPQFTLPWQSFPSSFVEDVEAYCVWLSGKDLFALAAPPKPSKPATIELRRRQIRILASAAVAQGFPVEAISDLSALVGQDCVRAALGYYHEKLNSNYTTYLRDLTRAQKSIARHWVRDEDQVAWIAERLRRMGSNAAGLTEKNRHTLRHFDDPQNVARIINLPQRLLDQAQSSALPPSRKAVRVQMALAIELLLVAPMRLQNLAQLRLDENIHWIGSGRERTAFISLSELHVKNRVPLEFPLPESSRHLLSVYLEEHRPHLSDADNPWLYPGENGHKQSHTLGQQLKTIIHKETGIWLTPHQFRHLAAKLYLDRNPGHYEVVRRLLGHRSLKTTVSFYTGLETRAALEHFDANLNDLRAQHADRAHR